MAHQHHTSRGGCHARTHARTHARASQSLSLSLSLSLVFLSRLCVPTLPRTLSRVLCFTDRVDARQSLPVDVQHLRGDHVHHFFTLRRCQRAVQPIVSHTQSFRHHSQAQRVWVPRSCVVGTARPRAARFQHRAIAAARAANVGMSRCLKKNAGTASSIGAVFGQQVSHTQRVARISEGVCSRAYVHVRPLLDVVLGSVQQSRVERRCQRRCAYVRLGVPREVQGVVLSSAHIRLDTRDCGCVQTYQTNIDVTLFFFFCFFFNIRLTTARTTVSRSYS